MAKKGLNHSMSVDRRSSLAQGVLSLLATGAVLLFGPHAAAQSSAGGWEFTVAPYLVAASMDGTVTASAHEIGVDLPFDTLLENLEMGFMGHFDMKNERWLLSSDVIYMDLEGSGDVANGTATVGMQQTLFEVAGGYRVTPAVTLLAGARWVDLGLQFGYSGPNFEGEADASKSWIDPLVGAHVIAPLGERWWLSLHGDVGGFGVGADLAWQAYANVGFRASNVVGIVVGYRALDVDYEEGSGADYFRYDVLASGPQIGVTFRF